MKILFLVMYFVTVAIAFFAVNRPLDQPSRNIANIILLIVFILLMLGMFRAVDGLR